MNSIIRNVLYAFTKKRIDENNLQISDIHINEDEISYFFLSTNSIASFFYNGEMHYFRECPEVLPFKEYLLSSIDKFFYCLNKFGISREHFSQDIPVRIAFSDIEIAEFKKVLEALLVKRSFLRKIANADNISQECRFSIWDYTFYDDEFFSKFGIENLRTGLYDIAICFLWYIRSTASSYRTLKLVRGKRFSYFSAVKAISSKIVADNLNLSHMITDARWCRLTVGKRKSLFGLLSSSAPGNRMADMKVECTPSLQRELNLLNALDVVCFQKDHGPNNYNITSEHKVCAFDNDNPSTFLPVPVAFLSMSGCSQLLDIKGNMLRPYFDKTLAKTLVNLDIRKLKSELKPYLNVFQVNALVMRIKMLNTVIEKASKNNKGFLLEETDWNEETILEEISGKYGTTYLSKIIK